MNFFEGVFLRLLAIRCIKAVVVKRFIKEEDSFREASTKGFLWDWGSRF